MADVSLEVSVYELTLMLHSLLRWLVLLAGLVAAARSLGALVSHRPWTPLDDKAGRWFTMSVDAQILLGLVLYGVLSPITRRALTNMGEAMRDASMRYWAVEHVSLMLIALAMVHVGRSRSRKGATSAAKHRSAAIFYTLALAAILAAVPWPFTHQGRPLFPGF
jgi:hypothetical protein